MTFSITDERAEHTILRIPSITGWFLLWPTNCRAAWRCWRWSLHDKAGGWGHTCYGGWRAFCSTSAAGENLSQVAIQPSRVLPIVVVFDQDPPVFFCTTPSHEPSGLLLCTRCRESIMTVTLLERFLEAHIPVRIHNER